MHLELTEQCLGEGISRDPLKAKSLWNHC